MYKLYILNQIVLPLFNPSGSLPNLEKIEQANSALIFQYFVF